MVKAAITMFAYAVTILVIGYTTMALHVPGASAVTAFIVPLVVAGLMIACAVASLMIGTKRTIGMVGIHVGLVLPLLFALAIGFGRLPKSLSATGAFNEAVRTQEVGVIVRKERAKDEPHPTAYQSVGMVSLLAVSGFAFISLVLHRPKVPPAAPKAPATDHDSYS